jgi:arylsulfatase
MNTWPDAGMTPFRSEKNTGWEGAYRAPFLIRWPGKIKAGSISNEIMSNLDWLPTLLAAAGEPDVKEKLLVGHDADGHRFRVHLDGYNFLPFLLGEEQRGPRDEFFYFSDGGDLLAMRYDNWKMHFAYMPVEGTARIWVERFKKTRAPLIFNLRTDPYERAEITSNTYWDWSLSKLYLVMPAQKMAGEFLATFNEFPPRQKPGSFTVSDAVEVLQTPHSR